MVFDMTEVSIMTPRGVRLAADFVNPVDTQGVAVLFVHSFLSDRHNNGWFDAVASFCRGMGYATLQMDCSGSGASDDDVITLEHVVEDIRAACSWLVENGFPRISIHAREFGGLAALKARPPEVNSMVLVSVPCDQRDYPWEQIFTDQQLSALEATGYMLIPDDISSPRDSFVVSKQTLRDMTMVSAQEILPDLTIPTLFLYDEGDVNTGRMSLLTDNWELLPDAGHHTEYISGIEFSDPFEVHASVRHLLNDKVRMWMDKHQPLIRPDTFKA